jgi:hypothetical protein
MQPTNVNIFYEIEKSATPTPFKGQSSGRSGFAQGSFGLHLDLKHNFFTTSYLLIVLAAIMQQA